MMQNDVGQMDKTSEVFVKRTKALLKERGLRQKHLAEYTGYTDSGLSTLFSKGNQSFDFLKKTALLLGTSTDHLLGLSDHNEDSEAQAIPILHTEDIPKATTLKPTSLTSNFAMYYGANQLADNWFCIRVSDAFAEPAYYKGDIVLIEPTEEVEPHQLALVYVPKLDQSVICFAKKGFLSYALIPKNPEFSDSITKLKPDELRIIGRCQDILKEEL